MNIALKVIAIILLGVVIIFAVQNMALVEVKFLFWSFETNRILIIGVPFVLGALFGPMVYRVFKPR
ncbi:DUF1049 domain-containing protein [Alkalicaulis satelles]|uniref:DUF1049 domain-containing protein n=1 Tax=Alkalicaulis satelles TaxID=2609175 RepID=A0A5M6ZC39_9PROT|nr:lipopolysaccharide assembly protein LapA domain-containing protein [Alkalicaulis satelles]KAA5802293.1 DUF1049 domain-containing protein [Alkalicaulis satelles]